MSDLPPIIRPMLIFPDGSVLLSSVAWVSDALCPFVMALAGVAVWFRSRVGQWCLAASAMLFVVLAVTETALRWDYIIGITDGLWILYRLPIPVAIIVLAFLPPVNRALRPLAQGPVMQAPPQYAQPLPQQGGYPQQMPVQQPQQQWQQGPPR